MEKKRKSYRKIKNQQKFILILITCVLIIAAIFLGSKLAKKRVNNLQTNPKVENQDGTSSNSLKKQEDKNNSNNEHNKDKVDTPKLDNSGYLSYEEDSNADDGVMVAENTKGLLNGTKHYPVRTDGKKVAYLTFDDGPSTTVTPRILDTLEKEGVDATFFVVGKYVDSEKELVKREAAEGNVVAIHSYTHDYGYLYPGGKINVQNCMSDFEKTEESIKNILGQDYKIRALRLPGGYYSWNKNDPDNAKAVIDKMHEKDWHQIEWNCLSGDAEGNSAKTAEQLYQETVQTVGTREKAVILMHDTYQKEATAEALPGIIQYLKQQGYEFKTIQ